MFVPSHASSAPPAGAVELHRGPRVWRLPAWTQKSNPERIAVLSRMAREAAADPRMRRLAVQIFLAAGVPERDYRGQAAALLKFMQERVYFVNEQDEVLQDPAYTLSMDANGSVGTDAHGDCDDKAVAYAALCRSVHLPVRFVTSGRLRGRPVRWVEGSGRSPPAGWSHVYNQVADHPFRPLLWSYADATLRGAALGWDVIGQGGSDPQRGALGDPGSAPGAGMTLGNALGLIAVSVAATIVVRKLERAGCI